MQMISFLTLRNMAGFLRTNYSSFFAWFGKISFEVSARTLADVCVTLRCRVESWAVVAVSDAATQLHRATALALHERACLPNVLTRSFAV